MGKKNYLVLLAFLLVGAISIQAQDLVITSNDIISNVSNGDLTATISKSGTDFTVTKTGGSTNPVDATYPNGSPLNTLPVQAGDNIEGLHLGSTWNGLGTGWKGNWGQLRTEQYTFSVSKDVVAFEFIIGALNNNQDGIERFRIVDVLHNGVSILPNVSFAIQIDFDDVSSDSIQFDNVNRELFGATEPSATCCSESSIFTITSTVAFDEVRVERYDIINNRTDRIPTNGENYTNGVTVTNFELEFAKPEIDVKGNFISIVNNDNTPDFSDSTDFGDISINATATKTYWIYNTGLADLNLTGPNPVTISGGTDFSIATQPSGLTIAPGDSLAFTVLFDPNTLGQQTATVSIANDDDDENPYVFDVTANAINNDPIAVTDYKTVNEDTTNVFIDVQINDTDPDGDVLVTTIISSASNGTVNVVNDDSLVYNPNLNFSGLDTVIYQICDPYNACDIDTVFITVLPVNDDPIAVVDFDTTDFNTIKVVNVQINDTDPDGDILTTTILVNGNNGTGTVLNNDSISYNPNNGFVGTDTLVYQICDPSNACDADTIFITVLPNTVDAVRDIDTTQHDITITVNVQDNDLGNDLTTTIVTNANNGVGTVVGDDIQYDPNTGFIGNDTIVYQICDLSSNCDIDTVFITVLPDSVDANTDRTTTTVNTSVDVNVLLNDTGTITTTVIINDVDSGSTTINGGVITYDPNTNFIGNDTLIYEVCNQFNVCDRDSVIITVVPDSVDANTDLVTVQNDTIVGVVLTTNDTGNIITISIIDDVNNGTSNLIGDSIVYDPNDTYTGADTLIYQICNQFNICDIDTLFITVTDNPVDAVRDIDTTQHDITITVDVQANDLGNDLTTTIVTNANNGVGTVVGDDIQYDPNTGFIGNDTIVYQICDLSSNCDIDTVFITVLPDSVDANTDRTTTMVNTSVDVNVLLNDTGTITTTVIINDVDSGSTTINGGVITYDPNTNFIGNDTLIYEVCNQFNVCDRDSVIITVVPDSVDANTDLVTVQNDTIVGVVLTTNDTGNITTISIIDDVNNGTSNLIGDSVVYDPNDTYTGADTLIYQICNQFNICDIDTLFINVVQSIDTGVVAVNDTVNIFSNTGLDLNDLINVQLNDTDYHVNGVLTTTILTNAINGTSTTADGITIDYSGTDYFYGQDSLTYVICTSADNGTNDCDTATVYINISGPDCDNDGIPDWVDNESLCDLFIPDGFSPNNDGINDTWVIRNISDYPDNYIRIFNRWGNLVFESRNYQDDWDGSTMFGLTIGGTDLPEGTYFYIVDLNNGTVVKGDVYLKR